MTSGCVHQRAFDSPEERITTRTAYTLQKHEFRVDAGLIGEGTEDLGANLSIRGAPVQRLELGLNVAHAAFGLLSADARVNILDRKHVGLGASVALLYTNPRALWVLPKEVRDELGNFNLVILPIRVTSSFPLARWVALHMTVGYGHASFSGTYQRDSSFADGGIGSRTVFLEPQVTFYAGRRVALLARANLDPWAQAFVAADSEFEIEPGIRGGVVAAEWSRIPFADTDTYTVGTEVRFAKNTHMMFSLTFGRLQPFTNAPLPSLNFYWRFGGPDKHGRRPSTEGSR